MVNDPLKTLIEIDKEANNTDLIKIHRQRCWEATKCANCNIEVDKKTLNSVDYHYPIIKTLFLDENGNITI